MIRVFKASLFERTRSKSFWMLVIAVLFISVICTPQHHASIQVLAIDPGTFKQDDNPSWIPMGAALILGLFQPIFGYAFIKNAIGMDQIYGVYQLINTMDFHSFRYAWGKFAANFTILLAFWITTVIGTFGMLLIRFPGKWLPVWQFAGPFLVLLPGMAFIAVFSMVIDSFPALQKSAGTVLGTFGLLILYAFSFIRQATWLRLFDVSGTSYLGKTISQSVATAADGKTLKSLMIFANMNDQAHIGTKELLILPIKLKEIDLLFMLGELVLIGLMVILVAGLVKRRKGFADSRLMRDLRARSNTSPEVVVPTRESNQFNFVPIKTSHFNYMHHIGLEINRVRKSVSKKVQFFIVVVWIISWLVSVLAERNMMVPLIFLLSLPLLSELGVASQSNHLFNWLKTIPKGQRHQINAESVAGILVLIGLTIPIFVKLPEDSLLLIAFEMVIVLLAQLLGLLTKNSRLLTVLAALFWFVYLNGMTAILPIGKPGAFFMTTFYGGSAIVLWFCLQGVVLKKFEK